MKNLQNLSISSLCFVQNDIFTMNKQSFSAFSTPKNAGKMNNVRQGVAESEKNGTDQFYEASVYIIPTVIK